MIDMRFPAVIIIGAGGHAQDIVDVAKSANVTILGFLDDFKTGGFIKGKIDHYSKLAKENKDWARVGYVIGINNSKIRKDLDFDLSEMDAQPMNLIHSSAIVGHNASFDEGVVLGPGAVLTSNVSVGRHTHLNTHASINQGSTVGSYATLGPGAKIAGDVTAGNCLYMGINSSIVNNIHIGDNVTIGAGAVVIRDVLDNQTVVGVPAKPLER